MEKIKLGVNASGEETLIGLNGDLHVSDHVARTVIGHSRLFPHVVRHIAINRMEQGFGQENCAESMRAVRDELISSMDRIDPHKLQVQNLTANVKPARLPYFVQ